METGRTEISHSLQRLESPMDGTCITLKDIGNSELGRNTEGGFAVIPDNGVVYAPVSGTLTRCCSDNCVYEIDTGEGMKVTLCLSIDMIEQEGAGLVSLVRQGQRIRRGDAIADIDLPLIEETGDPVICTVLVSGCGETEVLKPDQSVRHGENGLIQKL